MPSSTFGLIELIFSFSVPILWAGWEIWKLKRERAKDAEKAANREREGG
jgi:hypothetical protein